MKVREILCIDQKMNGFFDGDFKRRPNVSIGGASRKLTKDELLAKAQREREQRQVSIFFLQFLHTRKLYTFLYRLQGNKMQVL